MITKFSALLLNETATHWLVALPEHGDARVFIPKTGQNTFTANEDAQKPGTLAIPDWYAQSIGVLPETT